MSKIIDLSWEITNQMPVFPGDPAVSIISHCPKSIADYLVSQITFGTHTGTHIDVPLHKIADGKPVDAFAIESFTGRALVIDLTFLKPGETIQLKDVVKHEADILTCSVILLKTNWSEHYMKADFFSEFPGIAFETAKWLSNQSIHMIGLETPSVHTTEHIKIHEIFLNKNIVIAESLCNLKKINQKFVQFFAVPLKLKGLDGSPVRAFAIEE